MALGNPTFINWSFSFPFPAAAGILVNISILTSFQVDIQENQKFYCKIGMQYLLKKDRPLVAA